MSAEWMIKMTKEVVIKSNKSGIRLILDKEIAYEKLLQKIADKFREMDDFFKDTIMTVSFENRDLTKEEEKEIVSVIMQNSHVMISKIVETSAKKASVHIVTTKDMTNEITKNVTGISLQNDRISQNEEQNSTESITGFYKGNLRSGQVLECQSSITIIGDVNPGAKVISGGNIVILGSIKGNAHAGAKMDRNGIANRDCFIFALEMKPIQLQIGDLIAKCPDKEKRVKRGKKEKQIENTQHSQIAIVKNGYIYIEPMTKESLNDIS